MIALLLAMALAGIGQTAPAPPPEIIVKGTRPPTRKQLQAQTSALTLHAEEGVARFSDPVCPRVVGFPNGYNAIVEERIRADARAAKIDIAKGKCRPNITVLIVDSGAAIVQEASRTHAWLFNGVSDAEQVALRRETGPVHAWTATELRSRDGDQLRQQGDSVPTLTVRDASILHLPTRQDIVGSVILLDVDAIIGKGLNQIGDYIAMRALAKTRPPSAATAADTILSLFTPGASPPATLTSFDRAYLEALYYGPATATYTSKVSEMANRIGRATARARKDAGGE